MQSLESVELFFVCFVARDTPHTLMYSDETVCLVWCKSPRNSMSLRGISGIVLGYSRLDGGAARARVGKVSLFSDFIRDRPIAFLEDIYKACSRQIVREV